ncbi:MAG: ferritin family protein [Candidatus Aerophobetes bacterium]|nr:ferritin family protein [Candidatus Aerophobetes bacterium]
MNDFSNVIRTAIKMEEDGIDFYHKAAKKTSHPFGKRMFLSFAEDEKKHLTVLRNILADLKFSDFDRFFGEKKPREKIKTVFREVKSELKERIAANPDELEALKIGMNMESESVEFYKNALKKSWGSQLRAFFKRLIEEEKEHYQLLETTRSYLKDSGDWFLWEERGLLDGG